MTNLLGEKDDRGGLASDESGFTHESARNVTFEWYTPPEIFDRLGLTFDLDPCSPGAEKVPWIPAAQHVTINEDGLSRWWWGRVWMNPPYGQETPKWMAKLAEHGNGVALVFARTDTGWFHGSAARADLVCFVKRRIAFVRSDGISTKEGAGTGSMLVAYGEDCAEAVLRSGLGTCFRPVREPLDPGGQLPLA